MRKTLAILIIVTLLGIVAAYEIPTNSHKTTTSSTSTSTSPTSQVSTTGSVATGTYKDGTYTGTTATNPYDEIQVAITISSGKITNATTPVLNGDNGHSQMINSYAVPQLNQQTISSQSAHIDGVSGASYTSQSYMESLQAAIDQAKA
jgi:uncharacterized protein with FMN-binding domain